jgi:hypothetical protein
MRQPPAARRFGDLFTPLQVVCISCNLAVLAMLLEGLSVCMLNHWRFHVNISFDQTYPTQALCCAYNAPSATSMLEAQFREDRKLRSYAVARFTIVEDNPRS